MKHAILTSNEIKNKKNAYTVYVYNGYYKLDKQNLEKAFSCVADGLLIGNVKYGLCC